MKKQKYVSDIIGDEYKDWNRGNIIFIETPTGSGKTTFILEKLLKYVEFEGKKMLYLVNRKILREQLEDRIKTDLRYDIESINNILTIKTYQELENECRVNLDKIKEKQCEYKYIISDECHYFLCDSTFNTNTQISYDYIMKKSASIQIFMSATIDNIKKIIAGTEKIIDHKIEKNTEENSNENSKKPKVYLTIGGDRIEHKLISYDSDSDYSYVKLNILNDTKEMYDEIEENKGKWIIFVDSI